MRVMSMHECYESVVLDRTVNRWFLRSDVLSWPQRAWISSGEEGGWSVVARDDRVTFGVRVVDSYRRCIEISLAQIDRDQYRYALQYVADYWNAGSTICWLPGDAYERELAAESPPSVIIPDYFNIGSERESAVLVTTEQRGDHGYLSVD